MRRGGRAGGKFETEERSRSRVAGLLDRENPQSNRHARNARADEIP